MSIQQGEQDTQGIYRVLGEASIELSGNTSRSWVTLTRVGSFWHPQYGRFELSPTTLQTLIRNFEQRTYGQAVFLDVAHKPENGSAGEIKELRLEQNKLRALVDWTPYGVDAIVNRGYCYISVDYTDNYVDNENQDDHGPLLFGAALVLRPHIKNLDRVVLSEETGCFFVHDHPDTDTGHKNMWDNLLTSMLSSFAEAGLDEQIQSEFKTLAEQMLAGVEDEEQAQRVINSLRETAHRLAASKPDAPAAPECGDRVLSEDDVKRILTELQGAEREAARKQQADSASRQKVLAEAINGTDGLSDDRKASMIKELSELITTSMSDNQIQALAKREIAHAHRAAAAQQLSEMGFPVNTPAGRVQLSGTPATAGARLQTLQHEQLRTTAAYQSGNIRLQEEKALPSFARQVLQVFDAQYAGQISNAVRQLSDGTTNINHTDLPVGFQREVIREAYSDLNVLQLVSTFVDPSATVATSIPYEERKSSGMRADGLVFERGGIPKACVQQKMHTAYISAMRLAIDVSNEVMHFSKSAGINWDAWARNLASATRLIQETLCRRISNEMLRASDSYNAQSVHNEALTPLNSGTYKTAEFPVVREQRVYDLQGNQIGSTQNPIVVKDGTTILQPYDGSGHQKGGKYYTITNYNFGYLAIVDGNGQLTAASDAVTISYSYATNVMKVDSDVPAGERRSIHLNRLLEAIGSRKALLSGERFVQPSFMLMSPILNDICTNAEQFTYQAKREGSNVSAAGDLTTVKSVPVWGTNAPGIDLGDDRILLGQRGVTSYTVAKPWAMSEPQESRDEHGQMTGAKESYGEEFSSIDTPPALYGRYTSVLFYSASNR